MSDLDALFRAVLDRPDDDTPRLVYADALDDLGAADRAAFVRRQVEAARAAPWEPAAVRFRWHHGETPEGSAWRSELPELPPGLDWDRHPFRRGFPAVVQAKDAASFVTAADRLFDIAPVESLELEVLPATQVADLTTCSALARLKRLVLPSGIGRVMGRDLFRSPHLSQLDDLVIGPGLTSSQTAQAVVDSPVFRGLRSLSYRDDPRGEALVAALAGQGAALALRSLDIQRSRLTTDGLRRLLGAPVAGGLECLDVGENHVGVEGFRELGACDRLVALRRLDARWLGLGSAGVGALVGSRLASRMRFLNLAGNNFGSNAGVALEATDFPELRVLDLSENRLGDEGVVQLLRGRWVAGLRHLDLSDNGIGAVGVEALLRAGEWDELIALDLGGNPLPPDTQETLVDQLGSRVSF